MRLTQEQFIIEMNKLDYEIHGSDPMRETLFGTIVEMANRIQNNKCKTVEQKQVIKKSIYKKVKETKDET